MIFPVKVATVAALLVLALSPPAAAAGSPQKCESVPAQALSGIEASLGLSAAPPAAMFGSASAGWVAVRVTGSPAQTFRAYTDGGRWDVFGLAGSGAASAIACLGSSKSASAQAPSFVWKENEIWEALEFLPFVAAQTVAGKVIDIHVDGPASEPGRFVSITPYGAVAGADAWREFGIYAIVTAPGGTYPEASFCVMPSSIPSARRVSITGLSLRFVARQDPCRG